MKDAYWFRHDATAGRAIKMRKMAHIYGHWGKGVYWDVVEILRDQKDYCFESDESSLQLLSDLIGCKDSNKFISWFNDCKRIELFFVEKGMFFNPPLLDHMKRWDANKRNGKKGGDAKRDKPVKPISSESPSETQAKLKRKSSIDSIGYNSTEENSIIIMQGENGSQHLSITQKDFNKLVKDYGNDKSTEYCYKVLNYSKNSNYKSLYLTANSWLKKDKAEVEVKSKQSKIDKDREAFKY